MAVDERTQLIVGVEVVCEGSDMNEMAPMHRQIAQRYSQTPTHWLADGGYPKYDALEELSRCGTRSLSCRLQEVESPDLTRSARKTLIRR